MISVNDHVFYGSVGVCRVTEIRNVKLGGSDEQNCYVLKPFNDSHSTIFVPIDNDALLKYIRPVLTRGEIDSLIQDMPQEESVWISNERERGEAYFAKIKSCDSRDLVRLIKTLYRERTGRREKGKTLSTTDSRIMAAAEKLLYGEFAFVLNIDLKDVVPFIQERIPQGA